MKFKTRKLKIIATIKSKIDTLEDGYLYNVSIRKVAKESHMNEPSWFLPYKKDIEELKTDVAQLKVDVAQLKVDIKEIKTMLTKEPEWFKSFKKEMYDFRDKQLEFNKLLLSLPTIKKEIRELK